MKKTILLLSALLVFTACGTQESQKEKEDELTTSVLNVDEEVQSIEPLKEAEKPNDKPVVKKKTTYQSPSAIKKIDDACSSKTEINEKDNCYLDQIKNVVISKDETKNTMEDARICDRITRESWQNDTCYEKFALKNLNLDFCDQILGGATRNGCSNAVTKQIIALQSPAKTLDEMKIEAIEKLDALCSSKINFFDEDDCYFEQIKTEMIYYKDNIKNTIDDVRICDRIRGVAWQYADCYQMFAVKNLNIDFCDYGSEPLYARPENSGYGTAEDCRKNLKYEYQDANWTATGASPTITTWPYEYKGTANLNGWMEYQLVYDPVKTYPFFHVAEESILKLPPPFQNKSQNYSISHNSPDVLEALKTFGPQNPATITVSRIKAPWEGAPEMDITKVQ